MIPRPRSCPPLPSPAACVVVVAVWLAVVSCPAAQEVPETASVPQKRGLDAAVDSARDSARTAATWLATEVDSWFGNKPFDEGGQVSDGEVSLSVYGRQDRKTDYAVTFNARLRLPNLETHTYLFTGRDAATGVVSDIPAVFAAKQRLLQPDAALDSTFFAGLGRTVGDSVDARIGFQGGLKPYAQVRFRKAWQPGADDRVELSQTLFVTQADRFGTSTVLSYQHQFSPTLAGRWLNAISVTQADTDAQWNASWGVFQSFGAQRLLSLELLASAKQNTGMPLTDYGLQMRWEQPVARNKLIGDIVFGHFWPQSLVAGDRSTAWAVGTGLKMKF